MADKMEIKAYLKETGYTNEDMQGFWDNLKETNSKVKQLSNSGINWSDMDISIIRGLPTQEKKLEDEKPEEHKQEVFRKVLEQKDKLSLEILNKINKGDLLNEDELRYMCENLAISEDRLEGSDEVTSICELGGRYFDVNWIDNDWGMPEYNEQPYEVVKRELIEISKTSVYIRKEGKNIGKLKTSNKILEELSEIIKGKYGVVEIDDLIRLYEIDE